MTELRRQERWQSVFFTLKDPDDGACLARDDAARPVRRAAARARRRRARPRLRAARALRGARRLPPARALDRALRARRPPRRARAAEARSSPAEGLFAAERKRPLPRLPRRIGLVTGNDAAAKRDVLTAITDAGFRRRTCSSPRRTSRARAPPPAIVDALRELLRGARDRRGRPRPRRRQLRGPARRSATSGSCARSPPARCRSSRPSATSRTRRSATSPPTSAPRRRRPPARLVVPDLAELRARLDRARGVARSERDDASTAISSGERRARLGRRPGRGCARAAERLVARAPPRALEQRRPARTAACARSRRARRSSAATRSSAPAAQIVRSSEPLAAGDRRRRRARRAAASARASRRRGHERRADLRGGQRELEQIVERLERGEAEPRRGDRALGARRGALPALPRRSSTPPRAGSRSWPARRGRQASQTL